MSNEGQTLHIAADHFETAVGDVFYNSLLHTLRHGDKSVALTLSESKILSCLMLRETAPVAAEELLRCALEVSQAHKTTVVEPHISRLRRKLREIGAETSIKAVRSCGYVIACASAIPSGLSVG